MPAHPPARWFDRSVRAVERSGGAIDPRALLSAKWRDASSARKRELFAEYEKGTIMAKKKKTKQHAGKKKSSDKSRRRKKKDGRVVAVKLSPAVKKMLGLRDEGVPPGP
jgi:hypothetical protein